MEPPLRLPFSIVMTLAPASNAASDAHSPAMPPPATTTSARIFRVIHRSLTRRA